MSAPIRMRLAILSLALISLTGPTAAQIQQGNLVLNSANPDVLVHYRPDGKVLQTSNQGTGQFWIGAAILPNGNWVTARRWPTTGVNIFDAVTGAEVGSFTFSFSSVPGDLGVFSDGTLAVVEQGGKVWRFDLAGNVIASWNVSTHPVGILVDDQDHVWTCDVTLGLLWHTDGMGNKINEFSTGGSAGDVTMANDGTLFVTRWNTGEVAHYAQDGTFLGAFKATGKPTTGGIAMAADQTLWVTGAQETLMFHFDQAGTLLGTFSLGPATTPLFLAIRSGLPIGKNYCSPAKFNSSGQAAVISAIGHTKASYNFVTLIARQMPPNRTGYFLNSDVQGFTPFPPGSLGTLCLGGGIGRHVKQIANTGAAGEIIIDLRLTNLPRPNGDHSVMAGDTWNFQCWFRDFTPGPTSNFTDGIEIVFD